MALDIVVLAAAKRYTRESLDGVGALKGVPCTIKGIVDGADGSHTVTFEWTSNSGVKQTSEMVVNDGADGKGIKTITINADEHLIITYDDDTTSDAGKIEVQSAVTGVRGIKNTGYKKGDVTLSLMDVVDVGDNLTFDTETNTLKADAQSIELDDTPIENSTNGVKSGGVYTRLAGKVDKVTGKGLSTNDYDDTAKAAVDGLSDALDGKVDKNGTDRLMAAAEGAKLSGIETGAQVNVQPDWNQTDTDADDFIKNKPSLATVATSGSYTDLSDKPAIPEAYDDTALTARVAANEGAISTLNGTGTGSVQKQVADAVAAIVDDAPEAYDTLKEISDWIVAHPEDTAAMNTQIQTNKENIETLQGTVGDSTDGLVKDVADLQSGKADKVTSATADDLAALNADGTLKDAGKKLSDLVQKSTTAGLLKNDGTVDTTAYLSEHQDISGKADKVASATSGNLAALDANGNLTDSGKAGSKVLSYIDTGSAGTGGKNPDDYIENGVYSIYTNTISGGWAYFDVYVSQANQNNAYVSQLAVSVSDGAVYTRRLNSSTWTAWKKVQFESLSTSIGGNSTVEAALAAHETSISSKISKTGAVNQLEWASIAGSTIGAVVVAYLNSSAIRGKIDNTLGQAIRGTWQVRGYWNALIAPPRTVGNNMWQALVQYEQVGTTSVSASGVYVVEFYKNESAAEGSQYILISEKKLVTESDLPTRTTGYTDVTVSAANTLIKGVSVTIPAGKNYILQGQAVYKNAPASKVAIANGTGDSISAATVEASAETVLESGQSSVCATLIGYTATALTYTIWGAWVNNNTNRTKYELMVW